MQVIQINGVEIALPDDVAAPWLINKLKDGTYEGDEARIAQNVVRRGERVLEIGACLGYVTTLAAQRTAPENVLSVEANPAMIPVIEDTLARNGCSEVELFHAAVLGRAEPDEMTGFTVSPNITASSVGGPHGRRVSVPAVGFHDLLRAHRPHVVLIDVEGAEVDFFDRPWAGPVRYVALELHPKTSSPQATKKIFDAMSRMNMVYDPAYSRGKIVGFRRVWMSPDPKPGTATPSS